MQYFTIIWRYYSEILQFQKYLIKIELKYTDRKLILTSNDKIRGDNEQSIRDIL